MLTIPQPISLGSIKDFINDEVHITNKASGNPVAILSFVAVDDEGNRLGGAPTIVVTLSGEAYNLFYAEWNSESLLYSSVTSLIDAQTPGASISGLTTSEGLSSTRSKEVIAKV